MDDLAGRPWPGNVRELRTAAERFVLKLAPSNASSRPNDVRPLIPLADQVSVFERRTIETTLRHYRGDISSVLAALDLPRRTLYHKMQRYGLLREDFIEINRDDGKEVE
jgi:two-component system C4-dicarboxylate transport response regulator DctD